MGFEPVCSWLARAASTQRAKAEAQEAKIKQLEESEELAWGLIANAYGGNWDLASKASGWKDAAMKWRDNYHTRLSSSIRAADAAEGSDAERS